MKFKSKIFIFSLFFLLISIIGCQQQPNLEKITAQVNEMNQVITKSMMENDTETSISLYTEDAITLPSYQPMIRGLAAIKEISKDQPPMNMKSFSLKTTDVWVQGNFVVEIGTYDLVMDMPADQGGEMPDKGKYLTLYEIQKDGSLLIKADTWNTDFNPWEQMMAQQEETKN